MRGRSLAVLVACAALGLRPVPARAGDWQPIEPSVFQEKAPQVESDADAEALFWDVRTEDKLAGNDAMTEMWHYVRIKIYTERGKESQSKVDIAFDKDKHIFDIAARSVQPDGKVAELKKGDVFERTIVKRGHEKERVKSFVIPGVEPGCVIEYRWHEVRDHVSTYVPLEFQRDIPVRKVTYHIKPLSLVDEGWDVRTTTFHGTATPFERDPDGCFRTSMENVEAFREEPHMPPDDQVRTWMLLFYARGHEGEPDKFWKDYGREDYAATKVLLKPSRELTDAANAAIGDAGTPEERLRRLETYCRTAIKNVSDDVSGLTDADREKLKENRNPGQTLARKAGTSYDVDLLFAALASAAGFDARLARVPDRGKLFFDPRMADRYYLSSYDVAVRVGDAWRFYDPAVRYLQPGMLSWREEGEPALIPDPKDPVFVNTPLTPPDRSRAIRLGAFTLDAEGTLEGDVQLVYTGHVGIEAKEDNDDASVEERETWVKDAVKEAVGAASLSNIKVENVTDPSLPFTCSFHLKYPGYAQRTGKRLFVQPAVFERSREPMFPATARHHPVYFHYPWSEADSVTIRLPEGYALDHADAPASFPLAEYGTYNVSLGTASNETMLVYRRSFSMGQSYFGLDVFPDLKKRLDLVHQQDGHTVALKLASEPAH